MNNISYSLYSGGLVTGEDYSLLHDFLLTAHNENYTYARFDWMMTNREYLDSSNLDKIALWKKDNQIVASVLYDHTIDCVFPIYFEGYEELFDDILEHIENVMSKVAQEKILIYVEQKNTKFAEFLMQKGYKLSTYKEPVLKIDLENLNENKLEKGYKFETLENKNYEAYSLCLFKGFDHELNHEKFSFNKDKFISGYERMYVNLSYKVSISNLKEYIAHCGIWYDKKSDFAVIEPVCVIPEYRNKGFGKSVVIEGLKKAKASGARYALVGSDSLFYKRIGFTDYLVGTFYSK